MESPRGGPFHPFFAARAAKARPAQRVEAQTSSVEYSIQQSEAVTIAQQPKAAADAAPAYTDGPACNAWTPALAKTPAYMAETSHLLIMVALVIAQGVMHTPEHFAQVLQRYVVGVAPMGILGQLNLEIVHIMYNVGILALMIPIMIGCGFFAKGNAWRRANPMAWFFVMFAFWAAVVHVPEHVAKVSQYLITGKQATPGFFGYFLVNSLGWKTGVLWLHFTWNVVEIGGIVYAFFAYDVPGALRTRFFGPKNAPRPATG